MHKAALPLVRIGLSTMAICTTSYGSGGLIRAFRLIEHAHIPGLKLTPLRGLRERELMHINPYRIFSYEGDWRGTPTRDNISFTNWALYGSADNAKARTSLFASLFPDAIAIDLGEDAALETSPGNSVKQETYLNHPGGVALDLWHVRELGLHGSSLDCFVEDLSKRDAIRTIDFQTRDRREFTAFMQGSFTDLGFLLRLATSRRKDFSICIELPPWWLIVNPVSTLSMLSRRITEIVNHQG